jgi:hypothetical protein
MSSKTIRIAALGVPHDYHTSLVPLIIERLGYRIQWTSALRADLLIYGSFYDINAPHFRYLPRAWRSKARLIADLIDRELSKRKIPPITLFHTAENLRHDHVKADFTISHDLNVCSDRHYRLPYWMEVIDWSHEGLIGNRNPRYGELLQLEHLRAPLGDQFLKRAQKAVLMSSHLREPRASCLSALQKVMLVDGMGPYFDQSIKDHHSSDFFKKDVLQQYAFNLCPENGIHQGYVTEKIPEAFAAGCLPISYVDQSVAVDFNPQAFINLAQMIGNDQSRLKEILHTKHSLEAYAQESLLVRGCSITPLAKFFRNVLKT